MFENNFELKTLLTNVNLYVVNQTASLAEKGSEYVFILNQKKKTIHIIYVHFCTVFLTHSHVKECILNNKNIEFKDGILRITATI